MKGPYGLSIFSAASIFVFLIVSPDFAHAQGPVSIRGSIRHATPSRLPAGTPAQSYPGRAQAGTGITMQGYKGSTDRTGGVSGDGDRAVIDQPMAPGQGNFWESTGEIKTDRDWKHDASVKGYRVTDSYGTSAGVAVISTEHRGDYYVSGVRSLHGGAVSTIWGPYGGRMITTLPGGQRTVIHFGHTYYYSNWVYYRPYYWGNTVYYGTVPPPYGALHYSYPLGSTVIYVNGMPYYYYNYAYYQETFYQGNTAYEVVPAPEGTELSELPGLAVTITIGTDIYHYHYNTFFRYRNERGRQYYVVVPQPFGLRYVTDLPVGTEVLTLDGISYFVSDDVYYLPYLTQFGDEYFIEVDSPLKVTKPVIQKSFTVPEWTVLEVRLAKEIDIGRTRNGDYFSAFLNQDLVVDGVILAPRGNYTFGKVIQVTGGSWGDPKLVLGLINLDVHGQTLELMTDEVTIDRYSGHSFNTKSSGIDADSYDSADSERIVLPRQTLIEFRLNHPLYVDFD